MCSAELGSHELDHTKLRRGLPSTGQPASEPDVAEAMAAPPAPRGPTLAAGALALAALLGGCTSLATESTSAAAGVGAAAISRGVTRNPAVVTGIGLGVQAAARAGLQYAERKIHQTEQDRIAAVAGALPVGGVGHWDAVHAIPLEADEQGEVAVSRTMGGKSFMCKEIVFSVEHTDKQATQREFYTATICRDGAEWKWATAEPATERWGALQ